MGAKGKKSNSDYLFLVKYIQILFSAEVRVFILYYRNNSKNSFPAMYGILFRKDEEAAYGNLRLWEAIGFFIPYFCNKRLCMPAKLYIVLGVLATGLLGCIIVEIAIFIKSRFCSVATINECNKK